MTEEMNQCCELEYNKNKNNLSNEKLIALIRKGDDSAWKQLIENNKVLIEKLAWKMSNGNNKIVDELCQAGWLGFVDAVKNFRLEKANKNKFTTFAAHYIKGEIVKELDRQLNSSGATGRKKYKEMIVAVCQDEMQGGYLQEAEESFDFESFIESLEKSLCCTDKGSYTETARALQIVEILKMMTDEKHTMTKSQLLNCLQVYRMGKHRNSVKPEKDNTLIPAINKIIEELDPLEYTGDNDREYRIKYSGYEEDRLLENMRKEKGSAKKRKPITDLYYEHPFSYRELDKLIELIAFSDSLSEEKKLDLIEKVRGTSSIFYKTPYVNDYRGKMKYHAKAIHGRFSGRGYNVRNDVSGSLKRLQEAINQLGQVSFYFQRYDADGNLERTSQYKHTLSPYHLVVYHDQYYCIGLKQGDDRIWHYRVDLMSEVEILKDEKGMIVPIEIKGKDSLPSGLRDSEWNPEQYMAEHLYMGYDESQEIQMKIKNTDYTMIHDWFGNNFRKIPKKCEEEYDVICVKTSAKMIVPWAMQYASKVEILNQDIRELIRKEIQNLASKYKI